MDGHNWFLTMMTGDNPLFEVLDTKDDEDRSKTITAPPGVAGVDACKAAHGLGCFPSVGE